MKILSGYLRGRNFYMPAGIKPTQDVIRKSVFDMLGQDLTGLSFIDIFAGSGAMGLEAISRGAERVVFIEGDDRCAGVIGENLTRLGINAYGQEGLLVAVKTLNAFTAIKELASKGEKFDIVFVDPPYGVELAKKTLKTLEVHDILGGNRWVIVQHEKREILPEESGRILRVREKKFGGTVVSIYQGK